MSVNYYLSNMIDKIDRCENYKKLDAFIRHRFMPYCNTILAKELYEDEEWYSAETLYAFLIIAYYKEKNESAIWAIYNETRSKENNNNCDETPKQCFLPKEIYEIQDAYIVKQINKWMSYCEASPKLAQGIVIDVSITLKMISKIIYRSDFKDQIRRSVYDAFNKDLYCIIEFPQNNEKIVYIDVKITNKILETDPEDVHYLYNNIKRITSGQTDEFSLGTLVYSYNTNNTVINKETKDILKLTERYLENPKEFVRKYFKKYFPKIRAKRGTIVDVFDI